MGARDVLPLVPTRTCEFCGGDMHLVCDGGLFERRWERWRCTNCTHEADVVFYLRVDEKSGANATWRDTIRRNMTHLRHS